MYMDDHNEMLRAFYGLRRSKFESHDSCEISLMSLGLYILRFIRDKNLWSKDKKWKWQCEK